MILNLNFIELNIVYLEMTLLDGLHNYTLGNMKKYIKFKHLNQLCKIYRYK